MQRYRIGEVSKILNIPVETIRFFEQKGIIQPVKDEFTNYRYYDAHDIHKLLEYRKYRELEFSLNESVNIIKSANIQNFIEKLSRKQEEANQKARYYELKAIKLQHYQNVLKNMPLVVGEYPVVNRPEGYYFIQHSYDAEGFHFKSSEELEGIFDEMMKYYTFVENIFRVQREWFDGPQETEEFQWGFTIKKKWADALGVSFASSLEYIPSVKSIYTILQAEEDNYFMPSQLKPVLRYMEKQGFRISGDVFGNHIATSQNEGKEFRYMEVWVPIENKQ